MIGNRSKSQTWLIYLFAGFIGTDEAERIVAKSCHKVLGEGAKIMAQNRALLKLV